MKILTMNQVRKLFFLSVLIFLFSFFAFSQEKATLSERLGYAKDAKLLIIHADDLGLAHSVNEAAMEGFENGVINSGSVMVPCPWFPEWAAMIEDKKDLDIGIHLTLTSEWKHYKWDPVLSEKETSTLINKEGFFYASSEGVGQYADVTEVEMELRAQIRRAKSFGIQPTHLDTHMGSLMQTPELINLYLKLGREFKLPLLLPRGFIEQQAPALLQLLTEDDILIDHFRMVPSSVSVEEMDNFYANILKTLPSGVTELIIHPAYDNAEMQAISIDHDDYGAAWRQKDIDFFSSDECRKLLKEENIHLITWREIGKLIK